MQLLRDIALFVEVVNTKSFTQAALNLDMPASTLSRRMQALEREIGLRLLNRSTRRVEVTEAGRAYYARCAHLVQEARVAHEDLGANASTAQGRLRLSATPDFAALYLPRILCAFTKEHPAVEVELDLTQRHADLLGENLDAALRIGKLPDSSLIARRIGSVQSCLYAAPSYLKIAPPLNRPADLAQHACIRMQMGVTRARWQLYHAGTDKEPESVDVRGRLCVGSMAMVQELALLGAGIGAIDQRLAADAIRSGTLVRVLPHYSLAPTPIHLLTPSRLMPARVRFFGDFLVKNFNHTLARRNT